MKINGVKYKAEKEEKNITYKDWALKLQKNFEPCFWVPLDEEKDKDYDIDKTLVNRRGIYKDVYKSSDGYTDYQLRPNVCVAMVVAPQLFDPENAR